MHSSAADSDSSVEMFPGSGHVPASFASTGIAENRSFSCRDHEKVDMKRSYSRGSAALRRQAKPEQRVGTDRNGKRHGLLGGSRDFNDRGQNSRSGNRLANRAMGAIVRRLLVRMVLTRGIVRRLVGGCGMIMAAARQAVDLH